VIKPSITDRELEQLDADGFRAVRVTETGARARSYSGSIDFNDLRQLAPRLKALGWHAQVWANCELSVAAAPDLQSYGIPIVFDHMGYFDPKAGVNNPVFQSFLSMLGDGDHWTKMTPIRLTKDDSSYEIIRPFHDALLKAAPDRALFASDWPFISMAEDPGRTRWLVDLFDRWTPDRTLRDKIFVENPSRLYRRSQSL
jgi:2-pyrone-4,6-dicarboxylate lactonase